jgi:hypothetical protein
MVVLTRKVDGLAQELSPFAGTITITTGEELRDPGGLLARIGVYPHPSPKRGLRVSCAGSHARGTCTCGLLVTHPRRSRMRENRRSGLVLGRKAIVSLPRPVCLPVFLILVLLQLQDCPLEVDAMGDPMIPATASGQLQQPIRYTLLEVLCDPRINKVFGGMCDKIHGRVLPSTRVRRDSEQRVQECRAGGKTLSLDSCIRPRRPSRSPNLLGFVHGDSRRLDLAAPPLNA